MLAMSSLKGARAYSQHDGQDRVERTRSMQCNNAFHTMILRELILYNVQWRQGGATLYYMQV